jgi:hypothetical protein
LKHRGRDYSALEIRWRVPRGSGAGVEGDEGMVQASLNGTLDTYPFTTFPADKRFDQAEARKGVEGTAMRALGATDFH